MANIFDILFNRKPKKPDFSGVDSRTTTTERTPRTTGGSGGTGGSIRPDFSRTGNSQSAGSQTTAPPPGRDFRDVQSRVESTERALNRGGSGGTGGSASAPQRHTVVAGDTLSHIAQRYYGDAGRWPAIYAANRDKLSDPDRIFPGQVLRIPADDSLH